MTLKPIFQPSDSKNFSFKDCICFQLGKILHQVLKAYRNEIAEYNLPHGQFSRSLRSWKRRGCCQASLQKKTARDRAAITEGLDRLEKDEWIARRPDGVLMIV